MPKKKQFDVEALWQIERVGAPSLSPDGAQAVATLTRHSMEDNKARTQLWLFSTLGGAPRLLTSAGGPTAATVSRNGVHGATRSPSSRAASRRA